MFVHQNQQKEGRKKNRRKSKQSILLWSLQKVFSWFLLLWPQPTYKYSATVLVGKQSAILKSISDDDGDLGPSPILCLVEIQLGFKCSELMSARPISFSPVYHHKINHGIINAFIQFLLNGRHPLNTYSQVSAYGKQNYF